MIGLMIKLYHIRSHNDMFCAEYADDKLKSDCNFAEHNSFTKINCSISDFMHVYRRRDKQL